LPAKAGDLFLIAPGAHYAFVNDGAGPLVVAEHRIPPAIAFV
jgi:mannose-6-phosphate isomerase-like protein (cupin superfamily)